jgi:hypothetical protein
VREGCRYRGGPSHVPLFGMRPTGHGAARAVATSALLGALLGGAACVPVVEPRYPDDVAAALANRPMRVLEGQNLRLYYPEARQAEARRFLYRVEGCVRYLRQVQEVHNSIADAKMTVVMPEAPFNNAFVAPRLLGYDTQAVVPTFSTADVFSLEFGLPPDPGIIGCHEITHYVHAEQVAGFSWLMNAVFGATYTPQLGLDSWFHEGLAVYYETKLVPGTGRLAWPLWRGAFAAAYAGKRISGSDLHVLQRDFHSGNAYLVGSQFVRFLADRYGEQKLWHLVHKQARSFFFPLGVNVRFWQAYDKSLSTLIDEFADEVATRMPARERPPTQRVVRDAGTNARYARARDGTEALIVNGHDSPSRLMVYGPGGVLRVSRDLTDVVPPRDLAIADPQLLSGLSFTDDARALYFVAIDLGPVQQVARLIRYDVTSDALAVVSRDLGGAGGSISPDGSRYAYARADGDHHDLAELDLRTGAWRVLVVEPHGAFVSQPRYAPDGRRLVATEFDGHRFHIVVFDAASGRRLSAVASGGHAVHDPSWIDDGRILYLRAEESDAGFQVYVHDLAAQRSTRVTAAPYLAFQPRAAANGTVRFLNRQGWGWTLDEVELPVPVTPPPVPVPVAPATTAASAEAAVMVPVEGSVPVPAAGVDATTAAPAPATPSVPPPAVDGVAAARPAEPASAFDGLFVPRLHGLMFQTIGRRDFSWGLVLAGNDRMEKHRWAMAGLWQLAGGGTPSYFVGYTNRALAPLTITATAAESRIHDVARNPDGSLPPADARLTLYRRDREANLDLSRAFWGNPIGMGFAFYETYRPGDIWAVRPTSRFAGVRAFANFAAVESTPYTGSRRALFASASAAVYPSSWTTIGADITDLRGEVAAVLPLPLLARHTLSLRLRGRGLVGSTREDGLLMVGGYGAALRLARHSDRPEPPVYAPDALPPALSFSEIVTGFEDHAFFTDRVAIAGAFYRYPFIIDWGTASALGILPAVFVRQLDFSLFGNFATDGRDGDRHAVAGGALTLRTALWMLGFDVRYQVARRLTDDRALVHLVTLGN